MKSDVVSALARAPWPVFLMDPAGMIHDANEASVEAFGPNIGKGTAHVGTIWLTDNEISADEFLMSGEFTGCDGLDEIAGTNLVQQAAICIIVEEGDRSIFSSSFPMRRRCRNRRLRRSRPGAQTETGSCDAIDADGLTRF